MTVLSTLKAARELNSTPERKAFFQGFAAATATFIRAYDEPSSAKWVIESNGFKLADFKGQGIAPFDMRELRKAFK